MWVLLLLIMTESGKIISYDQGKFKSFNDCNRLGNIMVRELGKSYKHQCIEWRD